MQTLLYMVQYMKNTHYKIMYNVLVPSEKQVQVFNHMVWLLSVSTHISVTGPRVHYIFAGLPLANQRNLVDLYMSRRVLPSNKVTQTYKTVYIWYKSVPPGFHGLFFWIVAA